MEGRSETPYVPCRLLRRVEAGGWQYQQFVVHQSVALVEFEEHPEPFAKA